MKQRIQNILREVFDSELINPLDVTVFVKNTEHERLVTYQISNLVSLADAKYLGLNEQEMDGGFTIFARFSSNSNKMKFLISLNKFMTNKHPEIGYKVFGVK